MPVKSAGRRLDSDICVDGIDEHLGIKIGWNCIDRRLKSAMSQRRRDLVTELPRRQTNVLDGLESRHIVEEPSTAGKHREKFLLCAEPLIGSRFISFRANEIRIPATKLGRRI